MPEFYFPDELWQIIKNFVGFEKYYLVRAARIPCTGELTTYLSNRSFQSVYRILTSTRPLVMCLIKLFHFLITHDQWIRPARNDTLLWDRFAYMVAIRSNQYLDDNACGCSDQECSRCYVHQALHTMSRRFYTVYLQAE